MSKIEIMNATTGEVTHMDAESAIGSLFNSTGYESASDLADAVKPSIKGVSAEKIAEIITVIADQSNDFYEGVGQIRSGETKKSYRIIVEEVGRPTKAEAQQFCEQIKDDPKALADLAKIEPEPEPEPEQAPVEEVEPEPSTENEQHDSTPEPIDLEAVRGDAAQNRMNNGGKDENPYDGGTDEYMAWAEAWDEADNQINSIIEDGRQTALAGLERSENSSMRFKLRTPPRTLWDQGFEKGKAEIAASSGGDENPEPRQADPFNEGRAAYMFGKPANANPYEPGLLRNKEWAVGFTEAESESNA